ncbi:MAG: hypothetical protein IKD73_09245 [Selenomonadaceae bacterium]|nr:hypothetical protein [Selenomonadaceae bacterium]
MKKFFASICVAGLLLSGCGSEKPVEQLPPKVEQTNKSPADEAKVKETIQAVIPAKSEAPAPPPAPAKVLNLGMTADQFQAAYNAKIREISQDVDWDVSSANLTSNPNEDVFEYAFSSDGILFWTVEKNTTLLKGVGVMSQPKDILESSKMSFAYTVAILTLSPELNIEQRNSLLNTLKLTTDKIAELETSRGIAVVGNVRYTTQFMGGTFLFTATAKDL